MIELRDILEGPNAPADRPPFFIYVFDNNKIHKDAKLWEIGLDISDQLLYLYTNNTGSQWLQIPRYSPEFNKPIEHVHSHLERAYKTTLLYGHDSMTHVQLRNVLRTLFYTTITAAAVRKDVQSLEDTYDAVIEAVGGLIVHKLR